MFPRGQTGKRLWGNIASHKCFRVSPEHWTKKSAIFCFTFCLWKITEGLNYSKYNISSLTKTTGTGYLRPVILSVILRRKMFITMYGRKETLRTRDSSSLSETFQWITSSIRQRGLSSLIFLGNTSSQWLRINFWFVKFCPCKYNARFVMSGCFFMQEWLWEYRGQRFGRRKTNSYTAFNQNRSWLVNFTFP